MSDLPLSSQYVNRERRRHRRVKWTTRVRGIDEFGQEFSAKTIDVCAGGLFIQAGRSFRANDELVLYIDEIGRVEGVVARVLEFGYAIEFKTVQRKRDKIADQLTWLINRDALGLSDERVSERRPGSGHVIAICGRGVAVECTVMDMSVFGVAVRTNGPRPLIGERVRIGDREGTCVRYFDGGFAVDFRTVVAPGKIQAAE